MTTERRSIFALLFLLQGGLSTACLTESLGRRGGLSSEQIDMLPPDVTKSYEVFAQKCSRCHTLARPLTAGITDLDHWREYVARMRRQPGSGISVADGETVLVFLKYHAEAKQKAQAERRGEPPPRAPSPPAPSREPSTPPGGDKSEGGGGSTRVGP